MLKSLIINTIGVFRVGVFTTLKTVKLLSLCNLQVTLRPSIKGAAIGQQGCPREDLPPWSCFFIGTLSQPLTLRGNFTSSMYLLPQRGGQNRLFCLRRWIHVCKYDLSAHVRLFLSCNGGRSWVFAPVVGFTCAVPVFLPLSSFIDIDPKCGLNCVPNCGKSPLSSGSFAICRGLCRCSARLIAR